jgi:tRNA-Thr(GGU) m(6)t(6)A37 methyltransferase TsaA
MDGDRVNAAALFWQSILLALAYTTAKGLHERLTSVEADLEAEKTKRQAERLGRINLQKENRAAAAQRDREEGYLYKAIGYVKSPFPDRRGTPRQPIFVRAARGRIQFDKKLIQHEHFRELENFSHLWVLFVFHENTVSESKASKVKPPRLHGAKVGCLSTRSPHRPNNIGLSVCEIVEVGQDYIDIACLDFVHGTPVIDVKPYIPFDSIPIPASMSLNMAIAQDGTSLFSKALAVPAWVNEADITMREVRFDGAALCSLTTIANDGRLRMCRSVQHAVDLITQVLRQDIRGAKGRNGEAQAKEASEVYECRLDTLTLTFTTAADHINIATIECNV